MVNQMNTTPLSIKWMVLCVISCTQNFKSSFEEHCKLKVQVESLTNPFIVWTVMNCSCKLWTVHALLLTDARDLSIHIFDWAGWNLKCLESYCIRFIFVRFMRRMQCFYCLLDDQKFILISSWMCNILYE